MKKRIALAESNYNEVKEFMKELELKGISYWINQENFLESINFKKNQTTK